MRTEHQARRQDLDRRTWASPTTVVFSFVTIGSGSFETPVLEFGIAYEGSPFFSYGSVLNKGELVEKDYPFITIGVSEWVTVETKDEDFEWKKIKPSHVGATLWINVSSTAQYELLHNFVFEGIAFKNPMVK